MVHLDPRVGPSDDDGAETVRLISHSAGVTSLDLSAVRADRGHPVPGFTGADRPTGRPAVTHRVHDGTHHLTRSVPTEAGERIITGVVSPERARNLPGWLPATMMFSRRWEGVPAELSETIAPWDGPGDRTPALKPTRLRRFLLGEPWAIDVLPAVLTMLDDAVSGICPVAIRYSDTDQAMRVLAALSQLLTPDEAWRLEFALPVVDPTRAQPAVMGIDVALHRDWDLTRCRELGVHVIDLEAKKTSAVEASAAAERHARWFIDAESEEGLKIALDGIARSRRWSQIIDAEAAAATVEAIDLMPRGRLEPEDAVLMARALGGLANSGCEQDLLRSVARRLHSVDQWPATAVTSLVDAVAGLTRAGSGEPARLLAQTLLELIRDHPDTLTMWDQAVRADDVDELLDLSWPGDEAAAMGRLFEQVAAATSDQDLPQLLRHAAALCPPGAEPLDDNRAHQMARQWADDPEAFAREGWAGRDWVVAALAAILLSRFDGQDVDALHRLRSGHWEWLRVASDEPTGDSPDSEDGPWQLGQRRHERLRSWLALAEYLSADHNRRLEILSEVTQALPEAAWLLFLGPGEEQVDEEVVRWVEQRRRVDHPLAEAIFVQLTDPDGPRHGAGRSMVSALAAIEHVDIDHPELASWIDNDHRVRRLWSRARENRDIVPNPSLVSLADHHGEIIHLDHEEIVAAIATLADVGTATRMAEPVLEPISDALAVRLDDDLRHSRLPALAATLRLMELSDDHWWGLAKDCLDELWDDRAQAAVRTELATKAMHLDPEERRQFAFYQQTQADGRLGRNLRRTRGALGDLARTVFTRD